MTQRCRKGASYKAFESVGQELAHNAHVMHSDRVRC